MLCPVVVSAQSPKTSSGQPTRVVATARIPSGKQSDAPALAAPTAAESARDSAAVAAEPPSGAAPAAPGELTPVRRIELRTMPDGPSVAAVDPGARLTPLARDRGWRRVQVTGWVPERELSPADASAAGKLSAADLRADPEAARGKTVRWEVQVLAFQLADALRRDLGPDEPYLLARGPGGETTLLYLAVPPSLVEAARAFPKASIAIITARVRNGRSEPVGVPILDLQSIARQ